jgi:hypothetical protein
VDFCYRPDSKSLFDVGRNIMAKPSYKTTNMSEMLDTLSKMLYGHSATSSIKADICLACGKPAVEFTDALSRREFSISGLCQKCQDVVFAPDEEDE